MKPTVIGLIPARSGSKRLPEKNVMTVNGHPLLAYAVAGALQSGIFEKVIVSTDSREYADIATHYGAEVPFLRPVEFAADSSRDFDWINDALLRLQEEGHEFDIFSILRPTSPFRSVNTIERAFAQFVSDPTLDSLRAVELCSQHPGKMWRISDDLLIPVLPVQPDDSEWFSSPTQSLPEVWVQNACIEFAKTECIFKHKSISGKRIGAFKTNFPEGLELNSNVDLLQLNMLLEQGQYSLPEIKIEPYASQANL